MGSRNGQIAEAASGGEVRRNHGDLGAWATKPSLLRKGGERITVW
jgi:hypothetical protein